MPGDNSCHATGQRGDAARVWAIVSLFAVLATIYSLATPIWESPDETGHFAVAEYVARTGSLPAVGTLEVPSDESHQPPLYYLITALPLMVSDTSDYAQPDLNPYGQVGDGSAGYNLVLHTDQESWPYHGTVLAFRLTRMVSVLIGAFNVLLTFLLARRVTGSRAIATTSALILAFTPTAIFTAGMLNNDGALATFSTLLQLLLVRVLLGGGTGLRQAACVGIGLGLVLLTKRHGIAFVPMIAAVYLYLSFRPGMAKKSFLSLLGVYLISLVVSGWWVLPNLSVYTAMVPVLRSEGPVRLPDALSPLAVTALGVAGVSALLCGAFLLRRGVSGWSVLCLVVAGAEILAPLGILVYALVRYPLLGATGIQYFTIGLPTYWAALGGGIIGPDPWAYDAYKGISLLGAVGLLLALWKQEGLPWKIAVFFFGLAFWIVALVVTAIGYSHYAGIGRFLSPLFSTFSILLSVGIHQWAKIKPLAVLRPLMLAFLGSMALAIPFCYLLPAYALPVRYPDPAAVSIPNRSDIVFGKEIELLGYSVDQERAIPGRRVRVTLYLRAPRAIPDDYDMLFLVSPSQDSAAGGRLLLTTYPGRGMYQTSRWKPGEVIEDSYVLTLPSDLLWPSLATLRVRFRRQANSYLLPAVNQAGIEQPGGPVVGYLKLNSPDAMPPTLVALDLDNDVALVGYDLGALARADQQAGAEARVTLYWRARQALSKDYVAFVHLEDGQGRVVAQSDNQPAANGYPTSAWSPGEMVKDEHVINLPSDLAAGCYAIKAGMYLPPSTHPVDLIAGDGTRQYGSLLLGQVQVTPSFGVFLPFIQR
ncbi:MAG: phospholipid carrier-dependent glycosyltransferase [Chloroflexota bacterium]|nr:phospholipid carrier-dependent glycosyltransferase [Chloroflexota bacterium]